LPRKVIAISALQTINPKTCLRMYCYRNYIVFCFALKNRCQTILLNPFCFAFTALLYIFPIHSNASCTQDTTGSHTLTIYVISPPKEINWESPAKLFRSIKQSYLKKIFHPKRRFIGHMAFCLESTLLPKPLYIGIAPCSNKEMRQKVLHDGIGFGALGYGFEAAMEEEQLLKDNFSYNKKEKRLHYIAYKISRQAVQNILIFLSRFSEKFNSQYAPNHFYGGSFWPLYKYEGSGCSALCVSAMALSNISPEHVGAWLVKRKIPMSLIGGELNNNKRVKVREIKTTNKWYDGQGKENIDYIDFEIYDPSLAAKWIQKKITEKPNSYSISFDSTGICFDYSKTKVLPITLQQKVRENPSLFIKNFYQKIGIPIKKEN
jgi:hypothetical protein